MGGPSLFVGAGTSLLAEEGFSCDTITVAGSSTNGCSGLGHGGRRRKRSVSLVGVNIHLKVTLHLLLDTGRVNVLIVVKVKDIDLDVNDTGVALIARDSIRGEAVGILFAAHESTGPRKLAILGSFHINLVAVQVGPVPVPVDGVDVAGLEVLGKFNVGLAGQFLGGEGAERSEFARALKADVPVVGLVALAVVVVAGGDELAALVAASSLLIPEEVDVKELLLILRLGGAIEVDGATVSGLVWLVIGEGGVAILKVHESDVVTRGSFKHRELGVLLKLELVEDLIARVSRLARGRENVLGDRVGVGRVRGIASHEATSITDLANHGAILSELGGILNPGVSRS
ncbi:hypothetical protein HG530_004485 [Fusarium avenaceum]|nr:hypothetical protein HG530_004485 [Fusarium avenaceum]